MNIEREIKLHLKRRVEPALAALAPSRRRVLSVYFDTPRHELRRAGIALRLRHDGSRWVQTLKAEPRLHAGFAARMEWELPVRGKALDPKAFPREEIRGATGIDLEQVAPRLQPVFETRFVRRSGVLDLDGKARAELAIDRGQIVAGARREPISELELELLAGKAKALLRFAEGLALPLAYESKAERGYRLAAGLAALPRRWRMPPLAADSPAAKAFAAIAGAALVQAGTNGFAMARSSGDPEYLHQLRVALRRLRSALRVFAPILQRVRPVKRGLRRLAPALGVARDWDVLVDNAPAYALPPRVLRAARARRNAARAAALEVLDSQHFGGLLFRSLRWLESEPWVGTDMTLAAFAPGRLEKLHASVLRHAGPASAKSRHRLRVRIKRLRYAGEFFAPAFPAQAVDAYLGPLRALQELIGELNDIAVARRLLRELGAAPGPRLARREQQLIGRLSRAWTRFERRSPYWRPAA